MTLKMFSLYELKKAALYPRKVYMRQKEKLEPGFMRSAMELALLSPRILPVASCDKRRTGCYCTKRTSIETSIVIDAGAYTGDWAQEILRQV